MLHLDIAYTCNDFQMFLGCLLQVFRTYVSIVSSVFFYILQPLYPDILKVDQVLHIGCAWEAASSMGDTGPLLQGAGALAHKPMSGYHLMLTSRIRRLSVSKSASKLPCYKAKGPLNETDGQLLRGLIV
jgi:hypothetical protein